MGRPDKDSMMAGMREQLRFSRYVLSATHSGYKSAEAATLYIMVVEPHTQSKPVYSCFRGGCDDDIGLD